MNLAETPILATSGGTTTFISMLFDWPGLSSSRVKSGVNGLLSDQRMLLFPVVVPEL